MTALLKRFIKKQCYNNHVYRLPETVLTTRFSYILCSAPFSVAAVASCLVGEVVVDEVVDDVDP